MDLSDRDRAAVVRTERTADQKPTITQSQTDFLCIDFASGGDGKLGLFWTDPIALLTRPFAALFAYSGEKGFASFDWIGIVVLFVPFLIALALNGIEKGFWCRYLCPLGGMLGLFSKFSPFKRKVERESCIECGICAQNCPVGAINPTDGFSSDPAECIQCTECAARCPKYVIRFHGEKIFKSHEFDPDRRELLGIGGAAAAAAASLRDEFGKFSTGDGGNAPSSGCCSRCRKRRHKTVPVAVHALRTVHCGMSQKIIKPSLGKGDWTAALTPIVDLSANFCLPDCNRCGQVCPSGAIRSSLSLKNSRAKIGVARVDLLNVFVVTVVSALVHIRLSNRWRIFKPVKFFLMSKPKNATVADYA